MFAVLLQATIPILLLRNNYKQLFWVTLYKLPRASLAIACIFYLSFILYYIFIYLNILYSLLFYFTFSILFLYSVSPKQKQLQTPPRIISYFFVPAPLYFEEEK